MPASYRHDAEQAWLRWHAATRGRQEARVGAIWPVLSHAIEDLFDMVWTIATSEKSDQAPCQRPSRASRRRFLACVLVQLIVNGVYYLE